MAKATASATAKPKVFDRVRGFFLDVKTEMSKVTWPTLDELKTSTQVVMMLLGLSAVVIYAYDVVFQRIVVALLELG